jgi:hypothetical protein
MSLLLLTIAIAGIFLSFPAAFWLGWKLGKDSVFSRVPEKQGRRIKEQLGSTGS